MSVQNEVRFGENNMQCLQCSHLSGFLNNNNNNNKAPVSKWRREGWQGHRQRATEHRRLGVAVPWGFYRGWANPHKSVNAILTLCKQALGSVYFHISECDRTLFFF